MGTDILQQQICAEGLLVENHLLIRTFFLELKCFQGSVWIVELCVASNQVMTKMDDSIIWRMIQLVVIIRNSL